MWQAPSTLRLCPSPHPLVDSHLWMCVCVYLVYANGMCVCACVCVKCISFCQSECIFLSTLTFPALRPCFPFFRPYRPLLPLPFHRPSLPPPLVPYSLGWQRLVLSPASFCFLLLVVFLFSLSCGVVIFRLMSISLLAFPHTLPLPLTRQKPEIMIAPDIL